MKLLPENENAVVAACLHYLRLKGHFCWRNNTGATRIDYTDKQGHNKTRMWRAGIKGSSDILGIEKKTGRFIAIECKISPNKTTELQDMFLEEINKRGGIAIVAYTLEDVDKIL